MEKIAILDDYQQVALTMADWSALSVKFEIQAFQKHFTTEDELINNLLPYQIVVLMRERTPFSAAVLARLPNLKLIVTTGMRNASIDMVAATKQEVLVCGTTSRSEPPTELTWTLILALAKNLIQENQAMRTNGLWQSSVGADLHGKRLGIIGLGKIGSRVAKIGLAFGMEVVAWSQNLTKQQADQLGVRLAPSKKELLEQSDFVSIHVMLSERTKGLIGISELKSMKSSAYLINTSRAQIVDQDALVHALTNHWIAGAALDVFEIEPLPHHHILRSLPNLLATPHLGYVSKENYRLYYHEIVENIQAFLAHSPIRVIS